MATPKTPVTKPGPVIVGPTPVLVKPPLLLPELVFPFTSVTPRPRRAPKASPRVSTRTLTVAKTGSGIPLLYGRDVAGANIYRAKIFAGKLVVLCVWCEGEIDAVEKIVIDGETFTGSQIHYTGTAGQTADAFSVGVWGQADTLPNISYSVLSLSQDIGLGISAVIRGRKIYDPRIPGTVYSDNAALVLADFIDTQSEWSVNWASVGDAADYCDEIITGSLKRWQVGLTVHRDRVQSTIDKLRRYANVFLYMQDGEVHFLPDEPRAVDHTFTGSDIKNLRLRKLGQRDAPTQVVVNYTIPTVNEWKSVEVSTPDPAASVPLRITRLNYPGYFHATHAYRKGAEVFNRATLEDLEATFNLFDEGLKVTRGDVVALTHPLGLTSKQFRVMRVSALPHGRWSLQCKEYDPAIYSGAIVANPTFSDTGLPPPTTVPILTNLALAANVVTLGSSLVTYKIRATWDATTYAHPYKYLVTLLDGADVIDSELTNLTEYSSPAVAEGSTYTVKVVVVSSIGIESSPLSDTIKINSLDDFVMEFTTAAALETVTIVCPDVGVFDASIDWGDGTTTTVAAYNSAGLAHQYAVAGVYEVRISGVFPGIRFEWAGSYLKLTKITNFGNTGLITLEAAFAGCANLASVSSHRANTAKVTSFQWMFMDCSLASAIDVTGFDTAAAVGMGGMFDGCSVLTSVDVTRFNTSNVTTMFGMFGSCPLLTSINVTGFNTSNVTRMNGMFGGTGVTTLDVRNFDTSKVTNMLGMFSGMLLLTDLDVSGFDTSSCTTFSHMFSGTELLTSVDVTGFDVSLGEDFQSMFLDTLALATLDISGWVTSSLTFAANMFKNTGLADIDIDAIDITNVTAGGGVGFCSGVTLPTVRYDAALVAYEALTLTAGSNTWDFGGSQYSLGSAAATARADLIANDGWTINDGGGV